MNNVAIELRGITKRFGSVVANSNVNLTVCNGEILSLLGENGSGKTTLMNMISGIYHPDEGQIIIGGEAVSINSPHDAFNYKIGMIHQHFKLVDVLTATENIVLGLEGKLDLKAAAQKIRQICDAYGFEIDPDKKIYILDSWSAGMQLTLMVQKLHELVASGLPFEEVCKQSDDYAKNHTKLVAVLYSIENLVKNGRVPKIVGMAASLLNLHLIVFTERTALHRSENNHLVLQSFRTGNTHLDCGRFNPDRILNPKQTGLVVSE